MVEGFLPHIFPVPQLRALDARHGLPRAPPSYFVEFDRFRKRTVLRLVNSLPDSMSCQGASGAVTVCSAHTMRMISSTATFKAAAPNSVFSP